MNLNQVTIPSTNVPAAIEFYKTLGLQLIVHTHENYARFLCSDGNSTFSIHKVDQPAKGNGVIIYFELENLDEVVEGLVSKGISFDEMSEDKSWLWREARLKDPDGNQLILYFAGENRINPPWKLKSG